ncbi:hypothetical protein JB92DRAFT_3209529 [Gautieria morchelliformis]|nr:hypothetical protein JB92DRAFT_3209529 [Gautieria morchelliformis]
MDRPSLGRSISTAKTISRIIAVRGFGVPHQQLPPCVQLTECYQSSLEACKSNRQSPYVFERERSCKFFPSCLPTAFRLAALRDVDNLHSLGYSIISRIPVKAETCNVVMMVEWPIPQQLLRHCILQAFDLVLVGQSQGTQGDVKVHAWCFPGVLSTFIGKKIQCIHCVCFPVREEISARVPRLMAVAWRACPERWDLLFARCRGR